MNKSLFFALLLISMVFLGSTAVAQRNVTPAIERDPVLEADANHNLDVARNAYKLKKAYKGVIMRFEETYAAYPDFSKIDEFLYLAGMSSYYLSINKGHQRVDLTSEREKDKYAPEKLKADAVAYFGTIIEKYPQSSYRDKADEAMKLLKAPQ